MNHYYCLTVFYYRDYNSLWFDKKVEKDELIPKLKEIILPKISQMDYIDEVFYNMYKEGLDNAKILDNEYNQYEVLLNLNLDDVEVIKFGDDPSTVIYPSDFLEKYIFKWLEDADIGFDCCDNDGLEEKFEVDYIE